MDLLVCAKMNSCIFLWGSTRSLCWSRTYKIIIFLGHLRSTWTTSISPFLSSLLEPRLSSYVRRHWYGSCVDLWTKHFTSVGKLGRGERCVMEWEVTPSQLLIVRGWTKSSLCGMLSLCSEIISSAFHRLLWVARRESTGQDDAESAIATDHWAVVHLHVRDAHAPLDCCKRIERPSSIRTVRYGVSSSTHSVQLCGGPRPGGPVTRTLGKLNRFRDQSQGIPSCLLFQRACADAVLSSFSVCFPGAEGLDYNNNNVFATKDNDNAGCAQQRGGPWWYSGCSWVHPMSPYAEGGPCASSWKCMMWYQWTGGDAALKTIKFMLKS